MDFAAPAIFCSMEKSALMKQLRYKAVEQSTLSSPLRILAVADGDTTGCLVFAPVHRQCGKRKCRKGHQRPLGNR
jgi:hypothetical protein